MLKKLSMDDRIKGSEKYISNPVIISYNGNEFEFRKFKTPGGDNNSPNATASNMQGQNNNGQQQSFVSRVKNFVNPQMNLSAEKDYNGNINPIRDVEIINLELALADLEIISNRIGRIKKKAETTKDKESIIELVALEKSKEALEKNIPLRLIKYEEDELFSLKSFNLLTLKPHIYLANIDENEINKPNEYVDKLIEYANKENSKVIIVSAKIESELSELNDEDKEEMLKELNIEKSGLDKLVETTYSLLGLKTYFTAGEEEVKAWTFKDGQNAKECAGIIHTDFEKGFIKAEVISYNDMKEIKNEQKIKEQGKLRLEGKDYLMQDGDICHFRFNL